MRAHPASRRRGMTLLELLVSLAVAGVAASMGTAALSTLLDRRAAVLRATDDAARAAAVRRTIVGLLEGVRLIPGDQGTSFQLVDRAVRGRAMDELTFVTAAPTPLGATDVVVRLHVDVDARTPERGLVAELREWRGTRSMVETLDPDATALDARCLTALLGDRRWVTSWISPAVLPQGVVVQLSGGAAPQPLLRLPITVAFGGGR